MSRVQVLLDSNSFARWLLFFVITFLLHVHTLYQPALWDSAMCIIPAALTLSALNFDISTLLQLPMYNQGGPNCHSTSLVTWIAAFTIKITDSTTYIPVLHLIMYAWMALGFSAIYEFAKAALTPRVAWLICAATMLFPPIFVQTGDIYLDGPVLASVALALNAGLRRQYWLVAIWTTIAVLTKESGIIVVPAMTLFIMLTSTYQWPQKFLEIAKATVLPVVAALGVVLIMHSGTVGGDETTQATGGFDTLRTLFMSLHANSWARYLVNAPDLLLALALGTILSVQTIARATRQPHLLSQLEPNAPLVLASSTILSFVAVIYIGLPLAFNFTQILIRYHILIFPFCLVLICCALFQKLGDKFVVVFVSATVLFFVANLDGRFYPDFIEKYGNDFSIAERSLEYQELLILQQQNLTQIQTFAQTHQVIAGFLEQKYLRFPGNGYVNQPTPNAIEPIKFFAERGGDTFSVNRIDECVYVNAIYPWMYAINAFLADVRGTTGFTVRDAWRDAVGPYEARILLISPPGKTC